MLILLLSPHSLSPLRPFLQLFTVSLHLTIHPSHPLSLSSISPIPLIVLRSFNLSRPISLLLSQLQSLFTCCSSLFLSSSLSLVTPHAHSRFQRYNHCSPRLPDACRDPVLTPPGDVFLFIPDLHPALQPMLTVTSPTPVVFPFLLLQAMFSSLTFTRMVLSFLVVPSPHSWFVRSQTLARLRLRFARLFF